MINTVISNGTAFAFPLFIMAVGGIYSERSGITNLALEGLQGFGAFAGALVVALLVASNPELQRYGVAVATVFAMLGGMLFAVIHAVLCIAFRANQVISGVVMNILSVSLTTFLTKQVNAAVFQAPSDKFQLGVASRFTVPGLSEIPVIGGFVTDVYPFVVIILVVAVVAYVVLEKTRFGMRMKACGDNPQAVEAAGVDVQKVRFAAVLVSGALSGLAGISFAYSISANFSPTLYMGYGYLSIAALIFGNWEILPTLGASFLFGFARSAGHELIKALGMSSNFSDVVMILPYVLTLVLLVFFSKDNRAPRALGEIYDRGKR